MDELPKLTIATDADVPAVVSLINLAFRGSGEDAGWSIREQYIEGTRITEDLLREDLTANPHATMLLWRKVDKSLLGCVWLEPVNNGVWYLGKLAIPPREKNAGLGRKLL